MSARPCIAVSMGDPCGIGPEILFDLLAADVPARLVVFGEARYLERAAAGTGRPLPDLKTASEEVLPGTDETDGHVLVEVGSPGGPSYGGPAAEGGEASFRYLESALQAVLDGACRALLTMPVSKKAWELAGHIYPGQTEFLGERCGARPVMMLAGGGLRISLVTTHLAVAEVSAGITTPLVAETAEITAAALVRDFAIASPRLGVMGLNPHASDGGRFGNEEEDVIAPAIRQLKAEGRDVYGPLSPDAAPRMMLDGRFDALVAMYHEQAVLPVKTLAFDEGVNVTLGLPIVRTSPDHGTAYDIAGKGLARPDSAFAALSLAVDAVQNRGSL